MKSSSLLRTCLFGLLLKACPSLAGEMRTWTSAEGKVMDASYEGLDGDNVKLQIRKGPLISVPLEMLSVTDRAWVKQNSINPPPTKTSPPATTTDAPAADWPRNVAPAAPPKVMPVKEDAAEKQFIYRTEHFEFRCPAKLGADAVREFGRLFEGTREVNRLLPLGINPEPEKGREFFVAEIFETVDDYHKAGGIKGSAGCYSSGPKAILVPLSSLGVKLVGKRYMVEQGRENDTLIHEITHQMMNHWLGKIPEWYVEGSAMYVGSCVFHPSGSFKLPRLGQTVKELQHLPPGKQSIWHLDYLMHMTPQQWAAGFGNNPDGTVSRNYTSAIALTYYFYHGDDKGDAAHMIAFMRDIAAGASWEKAQDEHLVRGRTYEKIEKEMTVLFRKHGIHIEFADGPLTAPKSAE